jgi:hypothetical protein
LQEGIDGRKEGRSYPLLGFIKEAGVARRRRDRWRKEGKEGRKGREGGRKEGRKRKGRKTVKE